MIKQLKTILWVGKGSGEEFIQIKHISIGLKLTFNHHINKTLIKEDKFKT